MATFAADLGPDIISRETHTSGMENLGAEITRELDTTRHKA